MSEPVNKDAGPRTGPSRRRAARRARRFLELPSILLIASWIGIWFIWPTGGGVTAVPQRRAAGTLFTYQGIVRDGGVSPEYPLSFFRAAVTGMVPGEAEPGADTPSMTAGWRPAFLDSGALPPKDRGIDLQADQAEAVRMDGYRPAGADRPVFPDKPIGVMRIVSDVSGSLRRCGFKMPDVAPESIRQADVPWQATLYVTCGADGKPESVFLESGTPDKELNAVLVRTMYQGSATRTGAACEGRVTVSYGRE